MLLTRCHNFRILFLVCVCVFFLGFAVFVSGHLRGGLGGCGGGSVLWEGMQILSKPTLTLNSD